MTIICGNVLNDKCNVIGGHLGSSIFYDSFSIMHLCIQIGEISKCILILIPPEKGFLFVEYQNDGCIIWTPFNPLNGVAIISKLILENKHMNFIPASSAA